MPGKLQGHGRKIKGDLTYFIQHGRNGCQQGQYFIGWASKHGIPDSICNNVNDFYTMHLKLYILNLWLNWKDCSKLDTICKKIVNLAVIYKNSVSKISFRISELQKIEHWFLMH